MKITIAFLLLFISISGFSQIPQGIPYQAAARNSNGQILSNTPVLIRFSIIDSIANGTIVYQETHNLTTNTMGLFSSNVGMGTPVIGTFNAINWGQNFKFLKVELDTSALGNNYIDMGTQQMMSVPYALFSGGYKPINDSIYGSFFEAYSFNDILPSSGSQPIYPLIRNFTLAPGQTIELQFRIYISMGMSSIGFSVSNITDELIFSNAQLGFWTSGPNSSSNGSYIIKNTSNTIRSYSLARNASYYNPGAGNCSATWDIVLRKY